MKRRTLDIIFVIGGVVMAALLAVLGLVLHSNANFAKKYVRDQLTEQQITFKKAETLVKDADWKTALLTSFGGDQAAVDKFISDNHLTSEAGSTCLQKYAGTPLDSGKKAECYANDFIRLHLADGAIYANKYSANPAYQKPAMYTYASIGGVQTELNNLVKAAQQSNDPNLTALQAEKAKVDSLRVDTLFRGETLRGLLLTSYGFSVFGDKAELAATVLYILALVLLLASVAGAIHAAVTPKDKVVLAGHNGNGPSA